jgi:hypothetical protein
MPPCASSRPCRLPVPARRAPKDVWKSADRRRDRHLVVIEDDKQALAQRPGIVHGFIGHARRHRSVADHGTIASPSPYPKDRAVAKPSPAEIEVEECAAPNGSYSLSDAFGEAGKAAVLAQGRPSPRADRSGSCGHRPDGRHPRSACRVGCRRRRGWRPSVRSRPGWSPNARRSRPLWRWYRAAVHRTGGSRSSSLKTAVTAFGTIRPGRVSALSVSGLVAIPILRPPCLSGTVSPQGPGIKT